MADCGLRIADCGFALTRLQSAIINPQSAIHIAAPWHFLNFLPLPHGHGSLRPTSAYGLRARAGATAPAEGARAAAGSADVINPSAAALVATIGAERRAAPGCPPAGPVRVRPGAGGPPPAPGTAISIGMLRHQSLNHPSAKVFSMSLIRPLNMSKASVLYSTSG